MFRLTGGNKLDFVGQTCLGIVRIAYCAQCAYTEPHSGTVNFFMFILRYFRYLVYAHF